MFRTGDFVRAGPDGAVRFLGRRDQQVKVRGFRIELGEIETTLRSHPSVRNAAIIDIGDALDSRRLAAFVETELPIPADELATYLRDRLPYYMVPDLIRTIAAIPRLPNGKIDRRWLPRRRSGRSHRPRRRSGRARRSRRGSPRSSKSCWA